MGSKHLGADMVFCWPIGEVAVMGSGGAVEILYRKELEKIDIYQKDEYIKKILSEVREKIRWCKCGTKRGLH